MLETRGQRRSFNLKTKSLSKGRVQSAARHSQKRSTTPSVVVTCDDSRNTISLKSKTQASYTDSRNVTPTPEMDGPKSKLIYNGREVKLQYSIQPTDPEIIKANICTRETCLSNGKPHRHDLAQCKEHPSCVAEPLQNLDNIANNVPQPLPTQNRSRFARPFLEEVSKGDFGQIGPQWPQTRTVVTQYSLDHYWAQQWNLDLESLPATLPDKDKDHPERQHEVKEKFEAVRNLFKGYSRRRVNSQALASSNRHSFSQKQRQWARAHDELKSMQLEILYLKSNMDPKVHSMIEKLHEGGGPNQSQGAGNESQQHQQKSHLINKNTSPGYFKLETCKDMIPLIYPSSMQVDPLIDTLNKEHQDLQRLQAANPGEHYQVISEKYYADKKLREEEEVKRVERAKQRNQASSSTSTRVDDNVSRRMQSEPLKAFFKTSEIQQMAERQKAFQTLRKTKNKDGQSKTFTNEALQETLTNVRALLKCSVPTNQSRQNNAFSTIQPKQTLHEKGSDHEHFRSDSASVKSGKQLRQEPSLHSGSQTIASFRGNSSRNQHQKSSSFSHRPFSSNTAQQMQRQNTIKQHCKTRSTRNQEGLRVGSQQPSAKPSVRLFTPGNRSKPERISRDLVNVGKLCEQDSIDELYSQRLGKQGTFSTLQYSFDEGNQRGQAASVRQSTRQTPKPVPGLKTFTITVKPRAKAESVVVTRKADPDTFTFMDMASQQNTQRTAMNSVGNSIAEDAFRTLMPHDPVSSHVFTDLVQAQESGRKHFQKTLKSARWQTEKDHIVDTMATYLEKHKPSVALSSQLQSKHTQSQSERIRGNQILRDRLQRQYQVDGLAEAHMPQVCQTFLSEAPLLAQHKLERDDEQRKAAALAKDVCSLGASLEQKTPAKGLQKSAVKANAESQKTVESHQTADKQSKPAIQISKVGESSEKQSSEQSVQASQQKVVPRDPKPDVSSLNRARLDEVKSGYIDAVMKKTIDKKKQRSKQEDSWGDNSSMHGSNSMMASAANSPESQKRNQSAGKQAHLEAGVHERKNLTITVSEDHALYSFHKLEPSSPGIGGAASGGKLRRVVNSVLSSLDDEFEEQPYQVVTEMELSMPELEWDSLKLYRHIKDMDSGDFWQQKGLQCAKKGKIDAAMDYYRQGLRKNPTNHTLIYSLAVCYSRLKKYKSAIHWFSKGVELHPRWINGLAGIAITYFNMLDFERALKFITLAKDNSKGHLMTKSKLCFETISFVHASCLKMTARLDQACKSYQCLEVHFKRRASQDLIKLLWGLVLIPLSDDRKLISEHFNQIEEYLSHMREVPLPLMDEQNLLLSKFCISNTTDKKGELRIPQGFRLPTYQYEADSPKLNFACLSKSIWALLRAKPFFRRFNSLAEGSNGKRTFEQVLERADVELYGKDQVVFARGRVGVVCMGAVEVKRHSNTDLLKPYVVKKAVEGDVIGWSEGDKNMSASPLSWLLAMQDDTEVAFFEAADWRELWNIQRQFSEHQIVLQKLEQNHYFQQLNLLTKYHLVFESLEQKLFYPGQLVMSVHERSPLCEEFIEFFKDGTSKFRREIDNKVMKQASDQHASHYTAFLSILNDGPQSAQTKQLQRKLTRNVSKDSVTELGSSQESSRYDEPSRGRFRGRGRLISQSQSQELLETDSKSASSNSTDYGVAEAEKFIKSKAVVKKATQAVTDAINDTLAMLSPSLANYKAKQPLSPSPIKSRGLSAVPLSVTMQPQSKSPVRVNSRSASIRPTLTRVSSAEVHRTKRKTSPAKAYPRKEDGSVLSISVTDFNSQGFGQTLKLSPLKVMPESTASDPGAKALRQQMNVQANYKFLMQRQVTQIRRRNQIYKREHKIRKIQMRKLLGVCDQLEATVRQKFFQSDLLRKMATLRSIELDEPDDSVPPFRRNKTNFAPTSAHRRQDAKVSSGLNNQHLVNRVEKRLEKLSELLKNQEGSDETLYQVLMQEMTSEQDPIAARREAKGVHFIDSGEVLVVNKEFATSTRLSKCDAFGMCNVLRKTGPEFLGDLRAGLRQVHTFFVDYEELNKRLSIPERIKIKSNDDYLRRFDGVISFVNQREKIPVEKLRRF